MTATTTQWPVAPRPKGSGRVAANVKAEMARRGVTAEALAQGTSISVYMIRRRLQGLAPFKVDELDPIAKYLGVTASVLVAEDAA